jgi:hypothetical protein
MSSTTDNRLIGLCREGEHSGVMRRLLHALARSILLLPLCCGWYGNAAAEDAAWGESPAIHLLLGGQDDIAGGTTALNQHTSAWEAIYEQPDLISQFGLQLRYLNEGYLGPTNVPWAVKLNQPLHYRDAYGLQFIYWSPLFGNCRVGSAFGPEIYFDTFARTYRSQYEDRHGVGVQPSVSAQCRISARWALELVASRSFDVASFDATSVLLGFSYAPRWKSDNPETEDSSSGSRQPSRYLELSAGRSEVDSFHMMGAIGNIVWATYGQVLRNPLALELSLVNEDVSGVFQRRGLAPQLVASHDFVANHVQLFFGVGPELTRYRDEAAQTLNTQINLLLSYGVRIPFSDRMSFVLRFGRIESAAGRNDADLLSAGFAMRMASR